jgi:hypothetical protein
LSLRVVLSVLFPSDCDLCLVDGLNRQRDRQYTIQHAVSSFGREASDRSNGVARRNKRRGSSSSGKKKDLRNEKVSLVIRL